MYLIEFENFATFSSLKCTNLVLDINSLFCKLFGCILSQTKSQQFILFIHWYSLFRWFKFTLKPPYTVAHGNLSLAIWYTSHWTSFVKFGLKTAWDISYDILWPILKYVNFWQLQGHLSNLSKKDAFRKSIFSRWRSNKASTRLGVLGGQVPRLYGGTIFGGGVTHLGHPVGHLAQKFHFLDTFAAAQRVLGIDWFGQESVHRCGLGYSRYPGLDFWTGHRLAVCWGFKCWLFENFQHFKKVPKF